MKRALCSQHCLERLQPTSKSSSGLRSVHIQAFSSKISAHGTRDKRLVVAIGWLGSKQKHFDKYLELWRNMGHAVVGTRPSTHSIVLPPLGDRAAHGFLQEVSSAQLQHPGLPVLYHIFSNAGFIFFGTMLRQLAMRDEALAREVFAGRRIPGASSTSKAAPSLDVLAATCGIIVDSAPSRLTPSVASRGFTAAVLGERAEGIEARRPALMAAARVALTPVLKLPPISQRAQEVWRAWDVVAPVQPQLYLYSSADALIPPSEVQLFMQQQAARGVPVHSLDFGDSPHCEHFRKHPDQYRAELQQFLDIT